MPHPSIEEFIYKLAKKEIIETIDKIQSVNHEISVLCMLWPLNKEHDSELEEKKKERDNLKEQYKETISLYKEICKELDIVPRAL